MSTQRKAEEIARAMMSPYNIRELKKAIEHMDPEILVFRFQYGNLNGMSEWKRKETWKQWCAAQEASQRRVKEGER